jgi:hypothetical protein
MRDARRGPRKRVLVQTMRMTTEKLLCAAATVGACVLIAMATHHSSVEERAVASPTSAPALEVPNRASAEPAPAVAAPTTPPAAAIDPIAASKLFAHLQTIRSQLELWKTQHEDRLPDLKKYPQWQQFTGHTSVKGDIKDGKGSFGPYFMGPPHNVLNNLSAVAISGDDIKLEMLALDKPAGFVMSLPSGKIFATDPSGRKVIADATLQRLQQIAREKAAAVQPPAPPPDTRETRLASLLDELNTLQAQLLLYKLQHHDTLPDLVKLSDWQQLTNHTDAGGRIGDKGEFGPYLRGIPRNPLTGDYHVVLTTGGRKTAKELRDGHIGYVMDPRTAQLWAVDEQGKCIAVKRVAGGS